MPRPLPEKYRIKISVEPQDGSGATLNLELEDVLRSDILAPDYRNDGIVALVQHLEYFWYGGKAPEAEL